MPRRRPPRPAPAAKKDRRGRRVPVYRETGEGGRQFGRPLDVLLIFPQPYAVGMSNLGFLFVYRRLREFPEVNVERAFLDDDGTLSLAVESGRDWRQFPVLALSCSYELDVLRFAQWARTAGLELDAGQRAEQPLLLVGGTGVQVNPHLWAGVADVVCTGRWEENETALRDRLRALSGLPPATDSLPPAPLVHNTLFAADAVFAGALLLELERGCRYRCPFCWYAHATARAAAPAAADLLAVVDRFPTPTVGLVSACLADYLQLTELLTGLRERQRHIGFASLRFDRLDDNDLTLLAACGMRTLTIAPETGAPALKQVVGKRQTTAELVQRLQVAAAAGIRQFRLYYLVGLPGEGEEELRQTAAEIATLARAVRAVENTCRCEVTVNPLVPKPGTPWAAAALLSAPAMRQVRQLLTGCLQGSGVQLSWGSWREAQQQHRLAHSRVPLTAL